MASPEFSPQSKAFDPNILDRSVIAIPLLNAIEAEVEQIEWVRQYRPELLARFNCAIFYNPEYPGGLTGARVAVEKLLVEAKAKTKITAPDETVSPPEDEAKGEYSFAHLSSRLVRKLIALNSDLLTKPILRIVPSRFEVVIDLNLEHQSGRDVARQWVEDNVEVAKANVSVNDDEQRINTAKSALSKQYLFARLEGRVIKELVRLDAASASKQADDAAAAQKSKPSGADTRRVGRQKVRHPVSSHLPHLAGLSDFPVHHEIARHGQGRRSAEFLFRRRYGHHVGRDGLRPSSHASAFRDAQQHRSGIATARRLHRHRRCPAEHECCVD
jgi:hypothetical protein